MIIAAVAQPNDRDFHDVETPEINRRNSEKVGHTPSHVEGRKRGGTKRHTGRKSSQKCNHTCWTPEKKKFDGGLEGFMPGVRYALKTKERRNKMCFSMKTHTEIKKHI